MDKRALNTELQHLYHAHSREVVRRFASQDDNHHPSTPQPGDINQTSYLVGQSVHVPNWPALTPASVTATVTRIHRQAVWVERDDGMLDCVDVAAIQP